MNKFYVIYERSLYGKSSNFLDVPIKSDDFMSLPSFVLTSSVKNWAQISERSLKVLALTLEYENIAWKGNFNNGFFIFYLETRNLNK